MLPINFNVVLSLDFKEGLNSGTYYNEIKKNLENLIQNYKLDKVIRIKDCSEVIKFKNSNKAEKFIRKKGINLLIWGGFSDNLKKDGKTINNVELKFTYLSPNDKSNKFAKLVLLDVNSKMALRNYWEIIEDNSYKDIKVVSTNIYVISNYIIGLTLKLYGRIGESAKIFEALYFHLKQNKDPFIKQIEMHLYNCYEILIKINFKRNKFNESILIAKKMYSIWPEDIYAISILATSNYKIGNFIESKIFVEESKQKHPNAPVTYINTAFFEIIEKKYKDAYETYKKAVKFNYEHLKYNPLEVVEFLIIENNIKKNPGILYAIGLVSYYYGDRIIAKNFLREFSVSQDVTCDDMRLNAVRLLKKMK